MKIGSIIKYKKDINVIIVLKTESEINRFIIDIVSHIPGGLEKRHIPSCLSDLTRFNEVCVRLSRLAKADRAFYEKNYNAEFIDFSKLSKYDDNYIYNLIIDYRDKKRKENPRY